MINAIRLAPILLLVGAFSGCTTVHEAFDGRDPDQVWTAMVAAARTPDYKEPEPDPSWIVRENSVWVDQSNNRIEIFRRLERDYYKPASHHHHEDADWKITVQMTDRDPPSAKFIVRQFTVPSHAWDEAQRYFDQVRTILGGAPGASETPLTAVTPAPQTQPDRPVVDIESLEPNK